MSDSEEEMDGLDDDTTIVPPVTPNTFGRGLIKRLGIAKTAEAAGSSINNKSVDITGVASPHVLATQSINENLVVPLRSVLREQHRAEAKEDFLSSCLTDDVVPTGLRVNVPLKVNNPPNSLTTKWTAILNQCSRSLMTALVEYHTEQINTEKENFNTKIMEGLNIVIPEFIADITDIPQKCEAAIRNVKETTKATKKYGKKRASPSSEDTPTAKKPKNGARPFKGKGAKGKINKTKID